MDKKTVRAAFQASLPVMAGYIVLGMGFGGGELSDNDVRAVMGLPPLK